MPTHNKASRHILTLFSHTAMHLGFIILQPSYLTHRKTAGFQNDFQSSYLIHNKYTGLDNYPNLLI